MSSRSFLCMVVLSTLVGLGACKESRQTTFSNSYTNIDSEGGGSIAINGVQIDIEGPLHYRYHYQSNSTGGTTSSATIEGHPFGIREGIFYIGAQEYGPAPSGAQVRVTPDGVSVNGEPRGAVPESVE